MGEDFRERSGEREVGAELLAGELVDIDEVGGLVLFSEEFDDLYAPFAESFRLFAEAELVQRYGVLVWLHLIVDEDAGGDGFTDPLSCQWVPWAGSVGGEKDAVLSCYFGETAFDGLVISFGEA